MHEIVFPGLESYFCLERKTFIFCKIFYSVTVQCLSTSTLFGILNQAISFTHKGHMSQLVTVIEALNTHEGIWTIMNLILFGNNWVHDEKYFFPWCPPYISNTRILITQRKLILWISDQVKLNGTALCLKSSCVIVRHFSFNTLAESFFYFLYKCKLRKQFISSKCAIWNQKLNVNFQKSKLQGTLFTIKIRVKHLELKKPQPVQIHGVSVCRKQKDPGAQHSAPADCCHQMNSVEYNSL